MTPQRRSPRAPMAARFPLPAVLLPAFLSLLAGPASAQGEGHPAPSVLEVRQEASAMQDRIGVRLDPELEFRDERDLPFKLRQYFPGSRPVILVLGYYGCPDMCGQVIHGMVAALNEVDLSPGTDYQILNVSIDPRETPAVARERKERFLHQLHRVGGEEGWRFLTGEEPAIRALAGSVGFRYFWAEHSNRFDHPSALLFVTPAGVLSRVITGTSYRPSDVRQALVEASQGQLGTFWDDVRMSCLTWDPRTQTYTLTAMTVMRIGGVLTVLALALMIVVMVRRESRRRAAATSLRPRTDP